MLKTLQEGQIGFVPGIGGFIAGQIPVFGFAEIGARGIIDIKAGKDELGGFTGSVATGGKSLELLAIEILRDEVGYSVALGVA